MAGRRPASTIFSRVSEFSSKGMEVFDKKAKIMNCKFCNTRVSWERKSVVDQHCLSATHIKSKTAYLEAESAQRKRQAAIDDSMESAKKKKIQKEEFVGKTVLAFVSAKIAPQKLNHPAIREWINTYVPGGGDLQMAETIRNKVIPELKNDRDHKLRTALRGKRVVVMCDETTNRLGQAVFVALFKVLPDNNAESQIVLAAVEILQCCNAEETSKCIIKVLNFFEVQYDNVVAVATDGAAYMKLCVRLLKELVSKNIVHVVCWAHTFDRVLLLFPNKLPRLNEFVAKTKKLFKNTRKRKNRYFKFLEDKYCVTKQKAPKLFPMPVMSRFDSWRLSVVYLDVYLIDIVEYAKGLTDDVKAISFFKSLSDEDVRIVQAEASFVAGFGSPIAKTLKLVEGTKYPMAHRIRSIVNELISTAKTVHNANRIAEVVNDSTKKNLRALPNDKRKNVEARMKSVSGAIVTKLQDSLKNNPSASFFEALEKLFCPSAVMALNDKEAQKLVPCLQAKIPLFDSVPTAQFLVLHGVFRDKVKEKLISCSLKSSTAYDVVLGVLLEMRSNHAEFVLLVLQAMYVAVSNIDSERAFSAYTDILTPKRCRLLPKNCEALLCLSFGDECLECEDEDDKSNDGDA